MWQRIRTAFEVRRNAIRQARGGGSGGAASAGYFTGVPDAGVGRRARRRAVPLTAAALAVAIALALYKHPPLQGVGRGEVGVRVNRLTGAVTELRDGSALVVPGLHDLRVFALNDRTWRAVQMSRADGPAPLQSSEGLSFGADLGVRYALDPLKVAALARSLPDDVGTELVEPAVQGVVYKTFAKYTVREIFASKRVEIQQAIENELKARLAADGVIVRAVQIGKIDLPADYKRGMETLLAEELAGEKMKYTLELKDKKVRETELEAQAEKARREIGAEAAAREQVIAAKAQEEAMKHVLPFKQRQIEQRQLEAEAEKVARIKTAEAAAQARRIEALGEADARQKLADAEAYRMDRVGKAGAEQMAREGELIGRHPLLIQKTMADKLSDKIQVIIAPPSTSGGFIGAALLGAQNRNAFASGQGDNEQQAAAAGDAKEQP